MQFLERKRSITLLVRQTSSPSPPPNSVFKNFLHRQLIQMEFMEFPDGQLVIVSAQRVQEVIEVAGSNHAIGVILNLAWGPNNFSPSMIWSWRTYFSSYGLVPVGCCPFPFSFSKLDIIDIFLSFYVIIIIIIYFICYSVTSFFTIFHI